jgi:hypothetical protein
MLLNKPILLNSNLAGPLTSTTFTGSYRNKGRDSDMLMSLNMTA